MKLVVNGSNRKGSLLVPLVIFGAIITLIGLLMLVFIKGQSFEKSLGDRQLELFGVYQAGEKYLSFVDGAADKAIATALLKVADTGLKKTVTDCGALVVSQRGQSVLWAKDKLASQNRCAKVTVQCYPQADDIEPYFAEAFRPEFYSYIDSYNKYRDKKFFREEIPKDYESVKFSAGGPAGASGASGKLKLVGIAAKPIIISGGIVSPDGKSVTPLLEYRVKPSFSEEVPQNILADLPVLVSNAGALIHLSRESTEEMLSQFNGNSNGLQWSLEEYYRQPLSCVDPEGSACRYICGENCGEDGCAPVYCSGTVIRAWNYDDVTSALSVGTGKSYLVSDPASGSAGQKELAYRFGVSWIENERCTQTCSGREPRPC